MQASEVAVEFLQAAMATSDAVAFMKTRPFVIEMLFKAGVYFRTHMISSTPFALPLSLVAAEPKHACSNILSL